MSQSKNSSPIQEQYINMKIGGVLIQMMYPRVLSYFLNNYGSETAKEKLKEIGRAIAEKLLEYWSPKFRNTEDLIKKMFKKISGNKVTVKRIGPVLTILDKKCILCTGTEEVKQDIAYCIPISGLFERTLMKFKEKLDDQFTKVRAETIQSRGVGISTCIHQIHLIKE